MTGYDLVPGRECGACVACCVLFEVQALQKPAGVRCTHLADGGGCGIYETRPDTCRIWMCGWRLIPGLPEEWRPDLSGILVYQIKASEPGFGADAFVLALSRGRAHLDDMAVLGFVQQMVQRGVPLYLTCHAGAASDTSRFLNRRMQQFIAAGDAAGFVKELERALGELAAA